jgi:hypothetical protein
MPDPRSTSDEAVKAPPSYLELLMGCGGDVAAAPGPNVYAEIKRVVLKLDEAQLERDEWQEAYEQLREDAEGLVVQTSDLVTATQASRGGWFSAALRWLAFLAANSDTPATVEMGVQLAQVSQRHAELLAKLLSKTQIGEEKKLNGQHH